MRFFCPACGTVHTLDDSRIPAEGSTVQCSKCGFAIKVKPPKKNNESRSVASTIPQMSKAGDLQDAPRTEQMPAAGDESFDDDSWIDESTDPGADDALDSGEQAGVDEDQYEESFDDEPSEQEAVPKKKPKSKKPKAASGHKVSNPLGDMKLGVPYAGCGRSGEKFRFRDLFYALQAPLDLRKTIWSAAGVFVGGILLMGVMWLSLKLNSRIAAIAGLIVGAVMYFACMFVGLAVAIRQSDREMIHGGRLALDESTGFVKQRLFDVVAFPFAFVVGILVLGVGIGIFHLIARIPYAGPLVYGVSFGVVILLAMLAVAVGVVMILSTFSYIPALEGRGVIGAAKHLWQLIKKKPGKYFLNLLASALVAVVLMWLFSYLVHAAFGFIGFVDSLAGGGQYSQILLSTPGNLFPLWALLFDTGLGAGKGFGWQFTIAGWLVFVYMLMLLSLVQGFVLTYFHSAGAVSYHLLTQDDEESEAK